MKLTSKGKREVEQVPWGVYLWRLPDGTFLGDGDGHFLMIASTKHNKEKIEALQKSAKSYGYGEGKAIFFSGHRIVSDEEYEEQLARHKAGLTPDIWDVAAIEADRKRLGLG
jgi:hypothetical protein